MNRKYNGSIIIWVICIFLSITAVVSFMVKNSYEDNSSLAYEYEDFETEQELYSFVLHFLEENKDNIRYYIYKNNFTKNHDHKGELEWTKNNQNNNINIRDININDDEISFYAFKDEKNKTRSMYFSVSILNEIFKYDKCFIDNSSDNKFQNAKNEIINKTISNPKINFNDDIKVNLVLDGGDYEFLFDQNYMQVIHEGEVIHKYDKYKYRKLAIIGKENTNILLHANRKVFSDELFIINQGNVTIKNLFFRGMVIVKNGNLYTENVSGEGRFFIDGLLISDDLESGDLIKFKINNKFGMMFDSMFDYKLKLIKR